MQSFASLTSELPRPLAPSRDEQLVLGTPAERADITAWLSTSLRPNDPERLRQEYPQVFEPSSGALFVTEFENGKPLAHATLLPVALRLEASQIDAALISHVFTAPEARGEGRASRVLAAAHDVARNLGLGLGLLWSESGRLYERHGYAPAGEERLLAIDLDLVRRALETATRADAQASILALEIGPPGPTDWAAIARLRDTRSTGVILDRDTVNASAAIPDLTTRVARRNGELVGFAMLGRGDDFRGVIHEWAGETGAVIACCESLLAAEFAANPDGGPRFLLAPADRSELPWILRQTGAAWVSQPLARMSIIDPEIFCSQIARCAPDLFGELAGSFDVLREDPGSLRSFLFDPADRIESTRARSLRCALPDSLRHALPLPLFIWGLESI